MIVRLWCDKEQLERIEKAKMKVLKPKSKDYVIVVADKEQVDRVLKENDND